MRKKNIWMRFYIWRNSRRNLVAVRQTAHATHDAEDIVIHGIHTEVERTSLRGEASTAGRDAIKYQCCGVNAREVTRARRLVLLGTDGKGIHVDRIGV
jgi:hypothetical protein